MMALVMESSLDVWVFVENINDNLVILIFNEDV